MRNFKTLILISLLLSICFAISVLANTDKTQSKDTPKIIPSDTYEKSQNSSANTIDLKSSVNTSLKSSSISPGTVIGDTWYDYQQNGTMGRMIDWGDNVTTGAAYIHFSWTKLPGAPIALRHYAYRHYNANTGALSSITNLMGPTDFGGYTQLQSQGNGAAIIGGHNNPGNNTEYQSHFFYNFAPGNLFWFESRITDTVAYYGYDGASQQVIWPKFAYQEGTDTVTHVLAQVEDENNPTGIYYFRKVGVYNNGAWEYPPYVVDTQNVLGHSITASKTTDRVAMAWLGRVPAEGDCDTCSNNAVTSLLWEQSENDVYYQTSDDLGSTWNPRVNVTKYKWGEDLFRAYAELSIMFDASDNLHIAWPARHWTDSFDNLILKKACRLFHYSENVPVIRVAVNNDWEANDIIECTGGKFELNISKVQISECDGKMYLLFVQYNDLPNGIYNDCATRANTEYKGSANGDLYLTVSSDGGTTWDIPRNLTNSRTPGCEPGVTGDCEDDAWPSMTRYGRQNNPSDNWSGATIVDPSGSYAGDMYFDVQYLSDRDPGGFAGGSYGDFVAEGTQQLSNMQWFRLACIEPVPSAQISLSPNKIDYLTWVKPGEMLDIPLTIENTGNVALSYTPTVVEDNGTAGWLNVSGLSGSVPSGLSNKEVGTLHLNDGGVQTTPDLLIGRIIFISNAPYSHTFEVNLLVVDTIVLPVVDTVSGYLSLAVSSDGNIGKNGIGRVNLDFVDNNIDCDTTQGVYLYDGSPFIAKIENDDTLVYHSTFGQKWYNPNGLKPIADGLTDPRQGSKPSYNWYATGTFVTPDSTIAMEQKLYAPTAVGANYMIKGLKIWSHDGLPHSGLRIGDIVDWDIPTDRFKHNSSQMDVSRMLLYQQGYKYPDGIICVDSDRRFGGVAYLGSLLNGTIYNEIPFAMLTQKTEDAITAKGDLIAGDFWNNTSNSGLVVESEISNQHTVVCYEPLFDLTATDTIIFYTALATVYDGALIDLQTTIDAANSFFIANDYLIPYAGCCVGLRGNVDGDAGDIRDISDLVYIVDFMFNFGPPPPCFEEADCNGDGVIDISDLVHIVEYYFGFGPPCAPCPEKED